MGNRVKSRFACIVSRAKGAFQVSRMPENLKNPLKVSVLRTKTANTLSLFRSYSCDNIPIAMNTLAHFLYFPPSGVSTLCCDVRDIDPADSEVSSAAPAHHVSSSVEIRTLPLPDEQAEESEESVSDRRD